MTNPDLRSRLRSATAQAHARLDDRVAKAGWFDDHLLYADYLLATWRARQPLERALDQCGAEQLFALWPRRKVTSALEADIADLSGAPVLQKHQHSAPVLDSPAQTLGVLYVLEGSALGARLLARRAEALGLSAKFGARHLALQTAMPTAWSRFLAVLKAARFDTEQEAECVEAAIATFALFDGAFNAAESRSVATEAVESCIVRRSQPR